MKRYTDGICPNTGEYFYRDIPLKKTRPPELHLDMDKFIDTQLPSEIFPDAARRLESLRLAYHVLKEGGCLPKNRAYGVQKQITLKAQRAMKLYRDAETKSLNHHGL